jgi:hypothetical protein
MKISRGFGFLVHAKQCVGFRIKFEGPFGCLGGGADKGRRKV